MTQFHIGDTVRTLAATDDDGCKLYPVGTIGRIVNIDENAYEVVRIEREEGRCGYWYLPEWLEKGKTIWQSEDAAQARPIRDMLYGFGIYVDSLSITDMLWFIQRHRETILQAKTQTTQRNTTLAIASGVTNGLATTDTLTDHDRLEIKRAVQFILIEETRIALRVLLDTDNFDHMAIMISSGLPWEQDTRHFRDLSNLSVQEVANILRPYAEELNGTDPKYITVTQYR